MPVLGHAFVGMATGMCTRPQRVKSPKRENMVYTLWLPITLILAYLPDITAQLLQFAGCGRARIIAHSFLFAAVASFAIAFLVSRWGEITFPRVFAISLFSILFHDLLDILQSTDRIPWWPISSRAVGSHLNILPINPIREIFLFSLLFGIFLVIRQIFRQRRRGNNSSLTTIQSYSKWSWVSNAVITLIILSAASTHYLRDIRENRFNKARVLVLDHRYTDALPLLEQAESWPSTAKPGRIDYLKALAHEGLGNRQQSEHYYLRSYRADPGYFWCVVDLAMFYASSPMPVSERRRLIAPYLKRLQNDFSGRKDLAGYLNKIERKLGTKKAP